MLLTSQHIPKSNLEEFVECFYFNKNANGDYFGNCYPTINQELFLNLGDSFEVYDNFGQSVNKKKWLSGAQSRTLNVKSCGNHLTTGVIFKPWGLYAGFGINAKHLFNKQVDSNNFFNFDDELINNNIPENQLFDFLEYYLTKSLKKVSLTITMKTIMSDLENENLSVLSEKLHRSKKTVIESFHKIIGVSLNRYYHLKSVCKALSAIKKNPEHMLTELAYELGFYDQSHFIRIFKEHVGVTPKQFRSTILKSG